MNTAQPGKTISIPAASDISATPCRFVTLSAGQLALASAGGAVVGVYTGTGGTGAGIAASVDINGMPLVEVGGSVTVGDVVKSDSTGRAVTASGADVLAGVGRGIAMATGSTGAIPVLLFPGPTIIRASGSETLTGAGAISLMTEITEWVATSDAGTLADGLYVGQRKTIRAATGTSGSNVLTPATVSSNVAGGTTPATFTFTTAGQEVVLEWYADGWKCVGMKQAGYATVADAGTANPLHAFHNLAVSGTDDAILPSGMFAGQFAEFWVISAAATPHVTVSGLFYLISGEATGVDVDLETGGAAAAGDMWSGRWDGARWKTVSGVNAAIST